MSQQSRQLGDEMVTAQLINKDQLKTALEYQAQLGGTITQIVVKLGYVPDVKMTSWMSRKYKIPVEDLMQLVLPLDLAKRIPWELIQKYQVVPIHSEGKNLTIATADPLDYSAIEELQFATSLQIDYRLSPRGHIQKAIREFAQKLGRGTPSQPAIPAQKRPASAGALASYGAGTEDMLADGIKERLPGGVTISRSEMRDALIPALIKKGVITRSELFDSVMDLLLEKGLIDKNDLRSGK
jgi:hypothetical protein